MYDYLIRIAVRDDSYFESIFHKEYTVPADNYSNAVEKASEICHTISGRHLIRGVEIKKIED